MNAAGDQFRVFYRKPVHNIASAVVITLAVVTVLSALFAVPYRGRQAARKATCQSNLKCFAQSLRMYADDYNGLLPSSYLVNRSPKWSRHDSLVFATQGGDDPPDIVKGKHTIWDVLYDHRRCRCPVRCPSDPASSAAPSYWYKLANDKAWYGVGCPKPRRSMGDYAFESDQIAFFERRPWHFGNKSGLRGSAQINVSFLDAHVKTIAIRNATSGDASNCAANSDGEPMYYNYDNRTNKQDTGPAKHTDPTIYSDKL